jgi:fermentation-respiration switch protein FrsA (DUF1100 family)
MRVVFGLMLAVAGAYLLVLALAYALQRTLLYPAFGPWVGAAQADLGPGFEDVAITTEDGERIVGWHRPPEPGRAVVLYFHGNGGSLFLRRHRARLLAEAGRGLLMVSYRGYSGSSGQPTEAGLHRDARAAYGWAVARYDASRIVLYGESLGSGVAVPLAVEGAVGGVILDAPFTSAADVARRQFWFLPIDWLMRDPYRSIDRIAALRAPPLVVHGDRDGIVPIALGRRLYAAAPEPKRFVSIAGGSHVDNLESPTGLAAVQSFLAEVEARLSP